MTTRTVRCRSVVAWFVDALYEVEEGAPPATVRTPDHAPRHAR
jgi:hypothetical protein